MARKANRSAFSNFRNLKVGSAFVNATVAFVYLFLYAPIVLLIFTSFNPDEVMRFPNTGYSLKWYRFFLNDHPTIQSLINSIALALGSSLLAGVIGTLCALGLVRGSFLGKRFLNVMVYVPLIVPPVITGIALVLLLYGLGVPKGFSYLIVGHTLLGLPFVVIVVAAQLYGFPRNLEEAAQNLGANEVETFLEVTLPLLKRGILAGMMFAFVNSLQEYPASQAWAAPEFYTLPIVMYNKIRDQLSPEINVIGVLMIVIAVLILLAYQGRSPGVPRKQ